MKKNTKGNSLRRISISALIGVYVLILAGGVVRSTGSGMGCPDWPRCFGKWLPPANAAQLPENYKEVYSNYRHDKNVRFARYLNMIGLKETAAGILEDTSIREESDFNALKTWTEYANRVAGVVVGLLIIGVAVRSVTQWNTRRWITVMAFLTLLLVIVQGWIGSIVVSTNLTPWTVTLHMILALVIVSLLVTLVEFSGHGAGEKVSMPTMRWLILCGFSLVLQIVWGTEVREAIDRVASTIADRSQWVANLGAEFFRHQSFAWVVLIAHLVLGVKLWKARNLKILPVVIIGLILGTIISGATMAYFSVSPYLQPVHLVIATLAFGLEFWLLLKWLRGPLVATKNAGS